MVLMNGCGASCPAPKPPVVVTVTERCMTPPDAPPPLGPFPAQNADGTYTLTEEYVQELAAYVYFLVGYIVVQYEKCGPEAE